MMEKYIQILKRTWIATLIMDCFSFVLIFLIGHFFLKDVVTKDVKSDMIGAYAIMILILLTIIFANLYKKRSLKKLKKEELPIKLQKYKQIWQTTLSCYSFLVVIPAIAMMYVHSVLPIIFSALAILLVIINKPNSTKVKFDLNLSKEDLDKFKYIKFTVKR